MSTADPRDAFDAAIIPGMRQRLAEVYSRFRAAERKAFAAHLPRQATPIREESTHVERRCPSCDRPPPSRNTLQAHGFDLVECAECALVYTRQVMNDRALAARYQEISFDRDAMILRSSPAYLELETARARYYLAQLGESGAKVGRLLEVGCGTGTLLVEAGRAGWQSLGVEPELAPAQLARERGAPVVSGYFPGDLPAGAGPFEAVAILDVLEHFAEPRQLLSDIDAHLAPGGRLVIQVPNWNSLLIRIEGAASSVVCPGHWNYFTPETLRELLRTLGYRDVLLQTVQSEVDRIKAYPRARITEALRSVRPDLTEVPDLSTSRPLHDLQLGYKLLGIFARDIPSSP